MTFTPIKWSNERKRVTMKELVTVNEYGSKPIKLANNKVTKR
jgi:hypothetical protein